MADELGGIGIKDGSLFGLGIPFDQAAVVVLPVGWDVTTSYKAGTSRGPKAILEASPQLDLYHPDFPDLPQKGLAMAKAPTAWAKENELNRKKAESIIAALESGAKLTATQAKNLADINLACKRLHRDVERLVGQFLDMGKIVGVVGGEHSVSLGALQAIQARRKKPFGILQIDAHMDLRTAYEGFTFSHASIMNNALSIAKISSLVQVGIRDYCAEELRFARKQKKRVRVFWDRDLKAAEFKGKHWHAMCEEIVSVLPKEVYVSVDIDGLEPWLCPSTGTPVPGGLTFDQLTYLLRELVHSGRRIIGFDLVEVAPGKDEWDGNVGARLLYQLCGYALKSVRS